MTLRAAIHAEIAGIAPFDAQETAVRDAALAWVASGVELCRLARPATPPRHLVCYFLATDGDHVLLVDHILAGLWLPTGGHVEPGEHPRDTVAREAMEELGVAARFVRPGPLFITATETVGATAGHVDVSLWYELSVDRRRALAFDRGEFRAIRWFREDAVPFDRADPELGRFLAKRRAP